MTAPAALENTNASPIGSCGTEASRISSTRNGPSPGGCAPSVSALDPTRADEDRRGAASKTEAAPPGEAAQPCTSPAAVVPRGNALRPARTEDDQAGTRPARASARTKARNSGCRQNTEGNALPAGTDARHRDPLPKAADAAEPPNGTSAIF